MSDLQTKVEVGEPVVRFDQPAPERSSEARFSPGGPAALGVIGAVVVAAAVVLPNLALDGPSPRTVAERYMAARASLDAEAAVADFRFDVAISDIPHMESFAEVVDQFAFLEVLGHEMTEYSCETVGEQSAWEAAKVDCGYLFTTNLSQVLGVEPIAGSFRLYVENGRIVRLFHVFNLTEFGPRVFDVFIGWLRENHPGVFERTWSTPHGRSVWNFIVSDRNLAELEGHIAEFEAAHAG